ncbi:MAG: anthranilate phosphoribosyltransferase [Candidatus Eutrophobiaceae bacterium]
MSEAHQQTLIKAAIKAVCQGGNLDERRMKELVSVIMDGAATPAQIGALLMGFHMKGETADEISGAVCAMRDFASKVNVDKETLVDTCGTGGDGAGTFNISTAAALVAAAKGAHVAKHGNRAVSGSSGSADVLEAAGVKLQLDPEQVAECIHRIGIGFLFAPNHHKAMRHVANPRHELGIRTLFNLLGPLANPAGALRQVIGVFSPGYLPIFTEVLQHLGSEHVMVLCAEDGLDEISIAAPTQVAELRNGEIRRYRITPAELGVELGSVDELRVSDARESLCMLRTAISGKAGAPANIVAVNAGAVLYVAGLADSLREGVESARDAMAQGSPLRLLEQWAQLSAELCGERA